MESLSDWLDIRDGDRASSTLIKKIDGSDDIYDIPGRITSTGNSMRLFFHTNVAGTNVAGKRSSFAVKVDVPFGRYDFLRHIEVVRK